MSVDTSLAKAAAMKGLANVCPTFVFVAHAGPLEPQGALLAASLHDAYVPRKIVCRVVEPAARWGALSEDVTAFLEGIGVTFMPCQNEIDDDYPIGNKIGALAGINGRAVFLDSDVMLMAPFSWHHKLEADAAAKPADIDTYSAGGGSWARVWAAFDRDVPAKAYTATVSGDRMRPYYNAGFISVKDGDAFAAAWLACAKTIEADRTVRNKRPWLDQVALPVAFAELGWSVEELGDAFNFPCHLSGIGDVTPYFAHYHYTRVIAEQPKLRFRFRELVARYPALSSILKRYEGWDALVGELA